MMTGESTEILSSHTFQAKIKSNSSQFAWTTTCQAGTPERW